MSMPLRPISKVSCEGRLVDHPTGTEGPVRQGDFYYKFLPNGLPFPQNIESIVIAIPVLYSEGSQGCSFTEWTVARRNHCNAQWSLSGTLEKPTLNPSLHWVGVWHGWLRDGNLISC